VFITASFAHSSLLIKFSYQLTQPFLLCMNMYLRGANAFMAFILFKINK